MDTIKLHQMEGAFILSVLAKYWYDQDIRRVMRLISSKSKVGKEETLIDASKAPTF